MNESTYAFAGIIVYLVILFLGLYTLALAYHWFTYGSSRKTSMTALIIFLSGCGVLVVSLITAYNFL